VLPFALTIAFGTFMRMMNKMLRLYFYYFMIKYLKGSTNKAADFLSRPSVVKFIVFVQFHQFGFNTFRKAYVHWPGLACIHNLAKICDDCVRRSVSRLFAAGWNFVPFVFPREITYYNCCMKCTIPKYQDNLEWRR
jgi:hypothetical protein